MINKEFKGANAHFFQNPVNVFEGDDDVPEEFVLGEWEVSDTSLST